MVLYYDVAPYWSWTDWYFYNLVCLKKNTKITFLLSKGLLQSNPLTYKLYMIQISICGRMSIWLTHDFSQPLEKKNFSERPLTLFWPQKWPLEQKLINSFRNWFVLFYIDWSFSVLNFFFDKIVGLGGGIRLGIRMFGQKALNLDLKRYNHVLIMWEYYS